MENVCFFLKKFCDVIVEVFGIDFGWNMESNEWFENIFEYVFNVDILVWYFYVVYILDRGVIFI